MESLYLPRHRLPVLRYCRLSPHTASSPSLLLGESSPASFPEYKAHSFSKTLGCSSSWGISLARSLGLLKLNSHLFGVLLWLVKCHLFTQDTEPPFRRCKQESLPPLFGQVFHIWNKAAVEGLGWSGVKRQKMMHASWKRVEILFFR